MPYDYQCNFNLDDCIKKFGLEEKGRVQQFVTNEIMRLSDDYVPFDLAGKYEQPGRLKDSAQIENEIDLVYDTPYARRLYYNPDYNFQGKPERGAFWVDRMLQNGGLGQIENGARKVAGK